MSIKRSDIKSYSNKIRRQLYRGETSSIYLLKDGRVLKKFNEQFVHILKGIGYDIEEKIKISFQYDFNSKIKAPKEILYSNGKFCGYIMRCAKGVTFNQYEERLDINDRKNLYKYATVYNNLEKIIQDSPDIVIPDLLTCDNIFVDSNLGVELIDFDGFQVGNKPTIVISSSLGSQDKIRFSKKYYDQSTNLFSKELDIKSLIHLYFLTTFNIDLNKVGYMNPFTGRSIAFDDLFNELNLDDWDVMDRVWKVFQENKQNEYLGDLVFDMAEKYNMDVMEHPNCKGMYFKKLKKK